jgi:acetoacetyl-CoA reductase
MSPVAVVTGGTRGIGGAISKALGAAGYKVAANYASHDEAAAAFNRETGIAVYKWDVSSFDACFAGIRRIEADLGPVDILINNAGITRDSTLHKMTVEQWQAVINTNLNALFNMTRQVIEGMRDRGFGRIVNISSINAQKGQFGQANYSAAKARGYRLHQGASAGKRQKGHYRERHLSRLYRNGHGPRHAADRPRNIDPAANSGGPPRRA